MHKKKPFPTGVRDTANIRAAKLNLAMMQCCASGGYSENEYHNNTLKMSVYCLNKEMKDLISFLLSSINKALLLHSLQSRTISINRNQSPPRLKGPPNKKSYCCKQQGKRGMLLYLLEQKKLVCPQIKHNRRDSTIR